MKKQKTSVSLPVMSVDTLESLPFGAVFVDNGGVLMYSNPMFKEMFRIGNKDVSGKHIHDLLCQKAKDHQKDRCILIDPPNKSSYLLRQPAMVYDLKGKKIWVEFSTYPVVKNGKSKGFFITITPASVLSLSDESYHAIKAKFRAFFEAGPLAKFIIDDDFKVVDMNRQAGKMTPVPILVNQPLAKFFPKPERGQVEVFLKKMALSDSPKTTKFHYKKGEKNIYLEVFIHPHFIPGYHAVIFNDITAAETVEKNRDIYLSTIGHELKNPITVIKAYAQMLINKVSKSGNEVLLKYLKTIDAKTDVLTKLINDVVDELAISAEKMKLSFTEVDIDKLVANTLDEYRRTNPTHIFDLKGSTGVILKADATRVQQVIGNLLSNASKYSPEKSKVMVKLKKTTKEIIISVTDEGPGIMKQDQTRVFEAFYRGKPATGEKIPGLGLGLYLSEQIIKRHKGKIWLESKPGYGTTAYVTLPI